MSFLDRLKDGISSKGGGGKVRGSLSRGIGNRNGATSFEDDMIVSKPAIVFHVSQIFFNFLAMACFASLASFQAKWHVGPSGLSGFAIFVSVSGIFLSAFMLMVPVLYEKYDKFVRLARALKEVRVGFILTGTGVTFSLLIAFIATISAWTQPGCKNPDDDPHKDLGDGFKSGLANFCNTKKAGSIFFWFAFGFWLASLALIIIDWRSGKLRVVPRDPPFTRPTSGHQTQEEDDPFDDEESTNNGYPGPQQTVSNSAFADSNRYSTPLTTSFATPSGVYSSPGPSRPSMDAYGAFSDPAPSGFGSMASQDRSRSSIDPYGAFSDTTPPRLPELEIGPQVSRTMQYADPYSAMAASPARPPTYESYGNPR